MIGSKKTLLGAAAILGLLGSSSEAQNVLVMDGFDDGDRTSNPPWYLVGVQDNISLSVVNDDVAGGLNSGNALLLDYADTFSGSTAAYLGFDPVTLDNVGDYIEVMFDIRPVDANNDQAVIQNGVKLGLYDTNGTAAMQDGTESFLTNQGQDPGDGFGYGVSADLFGDSGSASEMIRYRPNLAIFNKSTSTDNFGGDPSKGELVAGPHSVALRLTLADSTGGTNPDSYDATWTVDGDAYTDNTSSKFADVDTMTFGNFMIGDRNSNAAGDDIIIDNVKVTTNVPEPASLGLIGLGAGVLGARRRL